MTVSETRTQIVAGRSGRRFRIAAPEMANDGLEVVVSADEDLAPLGRALRRHFGPIFAAVESASPDVGRNLAELLSRGTLLRLGSMRLESIDSAALPHELFVWPRPPMTRAALDAWRLNMRRRAAGPD